MCNIDTLTTWSRTTLQGERTLQGEMFPPRVYSPLSLKTLDREKRGGGEACMTKHPANSTNAKLKSVLAFK